MQSHKLGKNKGFSILELVTSLGVLAIISVIGLPSFLSLIEKSADRAVRVSLMKSYKECQINILSYEKVPTFELDMGVVRRNGFYRFYQQYDYMPRKDGYIPPTTLGNCIGPLSPNRLGVRKIKGKDANGEIWINLSTGEKIQRGGLNW
tara:strand:- start:519 stop:965 length:447 start_codon:yes stop_codon:yes gene_type:complete